MNDQRSLLDRVQDPDERKQLLRDAQTYERRHRWPLILGILAGVALGLFIGWSVWPVQWSNAWPNDLAPEAQANYIAAVADAYVSDPSSSSANLAAKRLAYYGEEIDSVLDEARTYFEASPTGDDLAQIANIDALAAAVSQPIEVTPFAEISSPDQEIGATEPDSDETASDETIEDDAVDDQPIEQLDDQILPAEEESSNWLSLATWLIVAFAMIAGGLFLLRVVLRMPTENGETDTNGVADGEINEDELKSESDTDDDLAIATPDFVDSAEPQADFTDDFDRSAEMSLDDESDEKQVAVMAVGAGALLSDEEVPDPDGYGFEPEADVVQTAGISTTIIPEIIAGETVDQSDVEVDDRSGQEIDGGQTFSEIDKGAESSSDNEDKVEISNSATVVNESSGATVIRGSTIATFTAHFQRSLDDYEEAFTIEDSSGYVGDCGMGVNMKVGLVDNNPEHVAVLDVWLVDQSGQAQTSFHALSLVSQYGVSVKLPERLSESTQPHQIRLAPRRGERFQIVGENLLIDCEVTDAKYAAYSQVDGVFTECQVAMTVRKRVN